MCTAFSTWRRLNSLKRDPGVVNRELVRAKLHLDFVVSLDREQLDGGRFFLHKHPEYASSWGLKSIKDLLDVPEVQTVSADQCQYGCEVQRGRHRGARVKKATKLMSNAPHLLSRLCKRCDGLGGMCSRKKGGKHVAARWLKTRPFTRTSWCGRSSMA